jgi:tRNA nucleotidyltransferase (CCA-adding enzyme)
MVGHDIMKCKQNKEIIQKALHEIYHAHPYLTPILAACAQHDYRAYLVGGAVRDIILQQPILDIDIEVHGCTFEQLSDLLQPYGYVDLCGKSFGVIKVHGLAVDWTLPRKDSAGRKPLVAYDPQMSIEQALMRRDLTMNAMAIDLHDTTLIDPFNGLDDINQNILRTPDANFFVQDPLRFFRVMQFIARFNMQPDDGLNAVCKQMVIKDLSRERIEQEFKKMLMLSAAPSLGIRWLRTIGRLQEIMPELAATIGVEQDIKWHPEGDVFEHSMQAVDAAAQLPIANADDRLIILYAALCHDIGKVTTTFADERGIHSYGHAEVGAKLVRTLLARITTHKELIDRVSKLILHHMQPVQLVAQDSSAAAYKRLAHKLWPTLDVNMLALLCQADARGRNPIGNKPLEGQMPTVITFLERAEAAGVRYAPEQPLLTGKDFLDHFAPGPVVSDAVNIAYNLQLEGIRDPQELKEKAIEQVQEQIKRSPA